MSNHHIRKKNKGLISSCNFTRFCKLPTKCPKWSFPVVLPPVKIRFFIIKFLSKLIFRPLKLLNNKTLGLNRGLSLFIYRLQATAYDQIILKNALQLGRFFQFSCYNVKRTSDHSSQNRIRRWFLCGFLHE